MRILGNELGYRMKKWIWWIVVGVYMGTIFYLSHQPATNSNELSTNITIVITETVSQLTKTEGISLSEWNHLVRKNTHFFAYMGLALLVWRAMSHHVTGRWTYLSAWGIVTVYAMTDEFHQLYVPGRGGQLSDVVLDSSGAATGLLFLFLFRYLSRK